MTQATKTVPAKKSTPAQVFDFSALKVEDSARPARTAGRTGRPVPQTITDAVTASWAGREQRANGRYVGKGKTLPNVPGTAVKDALYFIRAAGRKLNVGVGVQVQDRTGNRVDVKDVTDRAMYRIVFAAQTQKVRKSKGE